jgi:hypothetical protein
MGIGHVLLVLFIVGLLLLAIVPVFIRLRGYRHYAYFRVIDDRTKKPLAGAEVYRISTSHGRARVSEEGAGAHVVAAGESTESDNRVGTLDANGEFRGVFGRASGAFSIRAPGVTSGVLGLENVSEYTQYPAEPYVCALRLGRIVPPDKHSPITRGLPPGAVEVKREGYVNQSEKPERHVESICWPSLEEAEANNMNAGFEKYWKVTGTEAGPGIGGASFSITIETAERVKGNKEHKKSGGSTKPPKPKRSPS